MNFENGPVEVDESKPIWRYVGLPALLVYLEGNLRLQSVDSLRRIDPAEGIPLWDDVTQTDAFNSAERAELWKYVNSRLSPNDQSLWEANASSGQHMANQSIVFKEWRKIVDTTRYAMCFIESAHESMAMWRLFAPGGFSIRSSVKHLQHALKHGKQDWRVGRMLYWDRLREIRPDDTHTNHQLRRVLRHPYFLKSLEYSQENEVRLVTVDPDGGSTLLINDVNPFDWTMEGVHSRFTAKRS